MSALPAMLMILGEVAELPSATWESNLMTVLLILLLSVALALCLVCLIVVIHFLRSGRLARQRELHRRCRLPRQMKLHPPLAAVPSRWLAIRSNNPQAVQSALGLLKPR